MNMSRKLDTTKGRIERIHTYTDRDRSYIYVHTHYVYIYHNACTIYIYYMYIYHDTCTYIRYQSRTELEDAMNMSRKLDTTKGRIADIERVVDCIADELWYVYAL